MEPTFRIVRFYHDTSLEPREVIDTGLTLAEAREHCSREDTYGDGWFDGYEQEKEYNYKAINGRCEDAPCCGCCGQDD